MAQPLFNIFVTKDNEGNVSVSHMGFSSLEEAQNEYGMNEEKVIAMIPFPSPEAKEIHCDYSGDLEAGAMAIDGLLAISDFEGALETLMTLVVRTTLAAEKK